MKRQTPNEYFGSPQYQSNDMTRGVLIGAGLLAAGVILGAIILYAGRKT